MSRLFRSLHVQLFFWAIMPVTFVIIALSFGGVYTHQQTMRDFVASRDLSLARLVAQIAEDGIAHGVVSSDGDGLATWMTLDSNNVEGAMMILSSTGRVLAHSTPALVGSSFQQTPGVAQALSQREGFLIVDDKGGPVLVTFTPVVGTDWIVLIREPVRGLVGPILRFPSLIPVVAGGAGILSLVILTFGWLTIVRPLQQLSRAAGQVSWGNYASIGGQPQGVQEVRDLHQAIIEMVERIRSYEASMRDYLGAVTHGQEAERARVARELHDGPVQGLIVLGQRAEMAHRMMTRDQPEQAQAQLEELRETQRAIVLELRRLIGALRPAYLEDLGFVPALKMLIHQATERTDAEIRLDKDADIGRLSPHVELAAYRIAQEALSNALQHANARRIIVRVQRQGEAMILSVRDDGVGFELPRQPDRLTRMGHFGLMGMQERATLLGGTLQIQTAPGQGTRIVARLPSQPDLTPISAVQPIPA